MAKSTRIEASILAALLSCSPIYATHLPDQDDQEAQKNQRGFTPAPFTPLSPQGAFAERAQHATLGFIGPLQEPRLQAIQRGDLNPLNFIDLIGTAYEKTALPHLKQAMTNREFTNNFIRWMLAYTRNIQTCQNYCVLAFQNGNQSPHTLAGLIDTPHMDAVAPLVEKRMSNQEFRDTFLATLARLLPRDHEALLRYSLMAIQKGDRDPDRFSLMIDTPHENTVAEHLNAAMDDAQFRQRFLNNLSIRFNKKHDVYQRALVLAIQKGDQNPETFLALVDTPYENAVAEQLNTAMADQTFRKSFLLTILKPSSTSGIFSDEKKTIERFSLIAYQNGEREPEVLAALVDTPHEATITQLVESGMEDSGFRGRFLSYLHRCFYRNHERIQHYSLMASQKGDREPQTLAALVGTPHLKDVEAFIEEKMADNHFRDRFVSQAPTPALNEQKIWQHYHLLAFKNGGRSPETFTALLGTPHEATMAPELQIAITHETFRNRFLTNLLTRFGNEPHKMNRYILMAIQNGDRDPYRFARLIGSSEETAMIPFLETAMEDRFFRSAFISNKYYRSQKINEIVQRCYMIEYQKGDRTPETLAVLAGTSHENAITALVKEKLSDENFRQRFMPLLDRSHDKNSVILQRFKRLAVENGEQSPEALAAMVGTQPILELDAIIEEKMSDENFRHRFMSQLNRCHYDNPQILNRYKLLSIQKGERNPETMAALVGTGYESKIVPYLEVIMDDPALRKNFLFHLSMRFGSNHERLQYYFLLAFQKGDRDPIKLADLVATPHEEKVAPYIESAMGDANFRWNFLYNLSRRFGHNHESLEHYALMAFQKGDRNGETLACLVGTPHLEKMEAFIEEKMSDHDFRHRFISEINRISNRNPKIIQRYCLLAFTYGHQEPETLAELVGIPHPEDMDALITQKMSDKYFRERFLSRLRIRFYNDPQILQRYSLLAFQNCDYDPETLAALAGTPNLEGMDAFIEEKMSDQSFRSAFLFNLRRHFRDNPKAHQRYILLAIQDGDRDPHRFASLVGTPHEEAMAEKLQEVMLDEGFTQAFIESLYYEMDAERAKLEHYALMAYELGDRSSATLAVLADTQHAEDIENEIEELLSKGDSEEDSEDYSEYDFEDASEEDFEKRFSEHLEKDFAQDFLSFYFDISEKNNLKRQHYAWLAFRNGDRSPATFSALVDTPHAEEIADYIDEGLADEEFCEKFLSYLCERLGEGHTTVQTYAWLAYKKEDRSALTLATLVGTSRAQEIADAIEEALSDEDFREDFLIHLTERLGTEHPLAQDYIHRVLGYENADNPNSFLAVHQEMLRKREDEVLHNMTQLTPGVQHNLDVIQEARKMKSIHMPLNVWHGLFDQLQRVVQDNRDAFAEILGDVKVLDLFALRDHQVMTSLLDPQDSLKVSPKISTHSQMLREVLHHIRGGGAIQLREDGPMGPNLSAFLQLLMNIQTCATGKLNGITHSYIFLNQGRVLDESVLGTEGFKREIVDYFKEELRRKREGTLTLMLKNGLKINHEDPHDLYYIRCIIGAEVGLLMDNETPSIDFNASAVSDEVRALSKQQLLDLFYQYYKVEDVISIVHEMLNNDSIQISAGQKNLTLRIINEFLQGEAFDPDENLYKSKYVVTNAQGEPTGLTLEAAKALLAQLGIIQLQ